MSAAMNSAVSGLTAASRRLEVSADNVANLHSRGVRAGEPAEAGFTPHRVAQSSLAGGGVAARAVPIEPASRESYEPDAPEADADGLVPRPNVSLERELVEQLLARRAYEANLNTIKTEDRMLGALLDVLS